MTESLSEGSPSAETTRSPEDEDLLQRSTKKTKRVGNTAGQSRSGAAISGTQETPTAAGLMTPESAHWRTPGHCGAHNTNEGEGSMDENLPQTQGGSAQPNSTHRAAQNARQPVRDFRQNFGEWMLVARKDRRNNPRGGHRAQTRTGGNHAQTSTVNTEGPQLQSRYAALEGLEEAEQQPVPMESPTAALMQNIPPELPRIRTNQNSRPPKEQTAPQRTDRRQANPGGGGLGGNQMAPAGRGVTRGRGIRGGAPRRAAAESEHTVVRGSNGGKQIASTVVHHVNDIPGPSRRMDVDFDLLGDPPDNPGIFEDRPNLSDHAMGMDDNHIDPGTNLGLGPQC
nr:uncharacterized protein LOC109179535 isoform X2 [Ipomoea batatas]